MRSRDEVLTVESINDRLRELEQEHREDQDVIAVWRGRATRAENRLRELEAQLTLPPIREKFVRVSDELVAELKAAPSKPVTVAIVEDGNELHMTFTESQQAASEPVAWDLYNETGRYDLTDSRAMAREWEKTAGNVAYPLYRHPSAAAVTVTEAMVNAAAVCMSDAWHEGEIAWADLNENVKTAFRTMARDSLTAALTTASEGASDEDAHTEWGMACRAGRCTKRPFCRSECTLPTRPTTPTPDEGASA